MTEDYHGGQVPLQSALDIVHLLYEGPRVQVDRWFVELKMISEFVAVFEYPI